LSLKNFVVLSSLTILLLPASLSAFEYELSLGVHDFAVQNIVNDVAADGIEEGVSHTLGLNSALYVKHTTASGIKILAKAEAFLDYDTDHLDPDHIPIWFDFLIDLHGPLYQINENNLLRWYILMDNKQNTVSCIEREVRQHIGLGYESTISKLVVGTNIYTGFYYIEMDDDTPVARGYTRQNTDDGEASLVLELTAEYNFTQDLSLSVNVKKYAATGGFDTLEDNFEALFRYENSSIFGDKTALNFKIKYAKYDLERFYIPSIGVPILPFDNDMLIQAYVTFPLEF
jgi:hypothetical protein